MKQQSGPHETAEQHVKNIRRATRKKYSTEDKIRIVLSGLRGEYSIAELCRREMGVKICNRKLDACEALASYFSTLR